MTQPARSDALVDNTTRAFIAQAVAAGQRDTPLDINPALAGLSAVLIGGAPGKLDVAFVATEASTQGNGVVGGGTLANMLDSAMAVAVMSQLQPGQACSTISLSVNMQRAAQPGRLVATAEVDRIGARVAFAHAQLFDSDRRLLANATSSLAVLQSW